MLIRATKQARNGQSSFHIYHVYGLRLWSHMPLACPQGTRSGLGDAELVTAPASLFLRVAHQHLQQPDPDDWFHHTALDDGSTYLRWSRLCEFLISPDGRRIAYHTLNGVSQEVFQAYLVTQALSFALLSQGIEPLHATVAVVNDGAVAFLGNCGHGKSSLGAAFLQTGHALLTDDLLVVSERGHGLRRFVAHPGPPRIKLFPEIAHALLDRERSGVPMNPETMKLIIPLTPHETCETPVPLKAIYVLRPPAPRRPFKRITIRPLSPRRACLELIANTFNLVITERARLSRQFDWAARLASAIPVKSLSYPRDLKQVGNVVAAIHTDLTR